MTEPPERHRELGTDYVREIWEKPPRGGKLFAGISAVMTESLLVPEVPARELGSESDLRILVRSRFAIFPISSVSAFDHSG